MNLTRISPGIILGVWLIGELSFTIDCCAKAKPATVITKEAAIANNAIKRKLFILTCLNELSGFKTATIAIGQDRFQPCPVTLNSDAKFGDLPASVLIPMVLLSSSG